MRSLWNRFTGYIRSRPLAFRIMILVLFILWPLVYLMVCIVESWRSDEFTHFYRYGYPAFKAGRPL